MNKIPSPILMLLFVILVVLMCSTTLLVSPASSAPLYLAINEIGWSGTQHSPSDEWFELYNADASTMVVGGAYLELTMQDATTRTISIPHFTIAPNEHVLFERTDGTTTTAQETGVYVGALPNSGVVAIRLRFWDHLISDEILMPDGLWPAGSTVPRASMQRAPATCDPVLGCPLSQWDTWFTSTVGHVFDANEQYVLGTPGAWNDYPTEPSCDYIPYLGGEHGFDINLESHQPFVWYSVLMGDGTLASGKVLWADNDKTWANGDETHEDDVTLSCELLAHDYQQSITNILNAQPGVAPIGDTDFIDWLNELRRFQASRPWVGYLPVITQGE